MINFIIKYKLPIICVIVGVVSFLAGRMTTKSKETIKYVKGETITQTVEIPKPYEVLIPTKPILQMRTDTLRLKDTVLYIQKVDTAKILSDYVLKRDYKINLFNDKRGDLTVFPSVQYNELSNLNYEYTPITEVQTIEKKKVFVPFVGAGYSTNGFYNVGVGLYYHNAGLEYRYNFQNSNKYHTFNVNIKF